jgi:hypothetical protein
MTWLDILKKEIEGKGVGQVAKELGIGFSTVQLVIRDQYPASTDNIEKKVMKIYGGRGIHCPVLGDITPDKCAEKWGLAKRIGYKAGNPENIRLYHECLKCKIRKS